MKSTWWLLIVTIVIVALLALYWQGQQPKLYRLWVVNNSDVAADQVSLLGSGVTLESTMSLAAGKSSELAVQLRGQGELRLLVRQGLNRIDTLLVRDVSQLDVYRKRLNIEVGNRYLLGEME